jgi:hypothetical protein
MRLSVLLPASLAALLALGLAQPTEARADGYVGLGIGSDSSISGELSNHFATDEEATSSRVVLGQRFGALALEASLFGSQLHGIGGMAGTDEYSTISLGVDLKYHIGLIGALEGYGKIGLNKTWLTGPDNNASLSYEGRGEAMGLGLQYSFDVAVTHISLWADYTLQRTELRDGDRIALDGELGMANLGLSVGF